MKPKNKLWQLRILITDDHAITRLGIRQLLQEAFPHAAFGEAGDVAGTLKEIATGRWDLLILDVSLPDRDGLDALREIKERQPRLPVLIYSVHPEDQFALRALQLGAAGYLAKERAPEELANAVRAVVAGGTYVASSMAARLRQSNGQGAQLPHERLSNREFAVLRLIAAGLTGKAIAAQLGLNQKTVSTYRSRILAKMKLTSTADLVQYALTNQLMS